MADLPISGLPAIVTPASTDEMASVQAGVTSKVTGTQIAEYAKNFGGYTTNAILFGGSSNEISEDSTNFNYIAADRRLDMRTDINIKGVFNSGYTLGSPGAGAHMFYNGRTAAFRAGRVQGTQWDVANIGTSSFACNRDTIASGERSFAAGAATTASGTNSAAFGDQNVSAGTSTFAIGDRGTITGNYSFMWNASNSVQSSSAARSFILMPGSNGSLSVGDVAPVSDAIIQASSTTQGLLPPRMTTAERDAITTPTEGLVVYDTSVASLSYSKGGVWEYVPVVQTFTQTNSISGPYAAPVSYDLEFVMIDNSRVMVKLPTHLSNATTNAIITVDTLVPAQFRPGNNQRMVLEVQDNGQAMFGVVEIDNSGQITIGVTAAKEAFTGVSGGGTTGVRSSTFTYSI